MAEGKLISFWCRQEIDPRPFVQALADACLELKADVLVVDLQSPSPQTDPACWVARFRSLSRAMLRNYLANPLSRWGQLQLSALPPPETAGDLLELLASAYDWILVMAPRTPIAESQPLLAASGMVVWLEAESPELTAPFETFLKALANVHYPHAFARLVKMPDPHRGRALFTEATRTVVRMLAAETALRIRLPRTEVPDALLSQFKDQVKPALMAALSTQSALQPHQAKETVEAYLAKDETLPKSLEEREEILDRVLHDVLGLGPLEPLLEDSQISEIMVNGIAPVYVEKRGRLHRTEARFHHEQQLRTVIDRIVSPLGRRVDESMPICDARLKDGSRVNIVLPPLALDGPTLTIRKFSAQAIGLDDLQAFGSLSLPMKTFLTRAIRARKNILVSGGTGSGKTTLLNALSGAIPDEERIVTIEDAAELRLQKPHVIRLESRPPNAEGSGAISIRRLVMNALRMRPDRIVVGECRGGEALDMLQAMNTGHDGSMTTLHANTPRDALGRLETLVLMAGMDLPVRVIREQIRGAVHLIVQQARLADGSRKVISITEVTGIEGEVLTTQELFCYRGCQFEETGLVSANVPL